MHSKITPILVILIVLGICSILQPISAVTSEIKLYDQNHEELTTHEITFNKTPIYINESLSFPELSLYARLFIDGSWKPFRFLNIGWRGPYGTVFSGTYRTDLFTGYVFVGLRLDNLNTVRPGLYLLSVGYEGNKDWPAVTKHLRVKIVE